MSGTGRMKPSLARKAARKVLPKSLRRTIRDCCGWSSKKLEPEPNSYEGKNSYTIVSAAYNAEKYLDDFFISLINQTITKESLHVVMVDDGSTDGTADKIKEWQEKWPGGVVYVGKENGGPASARNAGLDYVETEWVTFIDSDDFVSKRYFENVDRAIEERPSLQMVSCNFIFYREGAAKGKRYKNSHPLRYRFEKGDKFFAMGDENAYLQLSVNSAFFRCSAVGAAGFRFDVRVKPVFEDAFFVGRFLVEAKEGSVAFLEQPRYYYRKRADSSSIIDTAWKNPDRFLMASRYGSLGLLEHAKRKKGYVPKNIQRTVLYDYSWSLKRFLDHPEKSAWLEESGINEEVLAIWEEIFALIDLDVVMSMPGGMLSFPQKYMTACFFLKPEVLPYRISYVQQVSLAKNLIRVESYGEGVEFFLDGRKVTPLVSKRVGHTFLGSEMPSSTVSWIRFENANQVLSFRSERREEIRLSVRGKQFAESVTIASLLDQFCKDWSKYEKAGDTWIIMDRDTQADDNGEHFCRYVLKEHPEQRVLFALRKDAPQYDSLKREGFPLVEFGSKRFETEIRTCSKIISSHADAYVHSYFGDDFHQSKDYVFLQHGVTHNNLSSWLNPKPISLMVATTPDECESIVAEGSPYRLNRKQILLSGLPRHDSLLEKSLERSESSKRCVLIAPTWRKNLMGETKGAGNERFLATLFPESLYRRSWEAFLGCEALHELSLSGARIIFFPHANMLPYVKAGQIDIPSYVEVGSCDGGSIQDYFCEADLCITDYSSVAFDVAYLRKPIIYYQFDQSELFGGDHIFARGYFSYEENGFGPVVETQEQLETEIRNIVANDFEPAEPYLTRMRDTFPFRDGKCCERVYDAIKALDEPLVES